MSLAASRWVWKNSPHKGACLLVQLLLADFANDRGIAWPSVGTLAERLKVSERWVQVQLRKLEHSRQIETVVPGGIDGTLSTKYRLPLIGANQGSSEPSAYVRDIEEASTDISNTYTHGGSDEVPFTPFAPEMVYEFLAAWLCHFFAHQLIQAGRKESRFAADADSVEWRGHMEVLLAEQFHGDWARINRIQAVIRHGVSNDEWQYVDRPAVLRDHFVTIERQLLTVERDAPPPFSQAPRTPEDWAARREELGLSPLLLSQP